MLAVVGALGRRRWLTLAGAGLLWLAALGLWVAGLADADLLRRLPDVPLPVLGPLEVENLVALLLVFAVGTVAAVAPGRFPLDRRLAVLALVVAAVTLVGGGFGPFGAPAFAYLVLWLSALRTPHLTRVGVKVDVSYGLYIYAFPVQQPARHLAAARGRPLGVRAGEPGAVAARRHRLLVRRRAPVHAAQAAP
ncbi:hypothetical protein GCM10025868_14600 [Angustibacter aerolatus]|uniref:Uncharacterized protein n=1 Tax=Angustibacter aerolatus TaxID=1162965 RepID=A0ABQ6JG77_9ACTN|nr:hypothetical protein [Angustibacter aerolatus]GMA86210.1 hypothetical protein GCM10025868_14600 [Angustibacter aerolatus]